ncbi:UNVERIFIED_CONTAM: hypothetical protein FKN15_041083 [Acipenser sinensis]
MALLKGVLLSLCCFLSTSAQDAVTVNCEDDMITVGVELNFFGLPLDPSGLSLGSCPVSSVQGSNRIAFFSYGALDCRFMRMVTSNISYMNNMVYEPTQRNGFYQTPFVAPVLCIYNKCFVDGRTANSRFLPRIQTSEIRLSVQAFKFTQDDSVVFIHCQILAWDPARLQDPTKKACSFNMQTKNWELLDNPDQSTSVCGCCNSVCTARRRRDTDDGLRRTAVLGPLRIASREQSTNGDDPLDQDEDLSLALLLIVATLLVMAVLGALSLGYYFCVWKSGRAGPKTNYDLLVSPQKS